MVYACNVNLIWFHGAAVTRREWEVFHYVIQMTMSCCGNFQGDELYRKGLLTETTRWPLKRTFEKMMVKLPPLLMRTILTLVLTI